MVVAAESQCLMYEKRLLTCAPRTRLAERAALAGAASGRLYKLSGHRLDLSDGLGASIVAASGGGATGN